MRFALALLLAGTLARADSLTDLKTKLAGSGHGEPVRAAVTFESSRQNGDETEGRGGRVSAVVEDSADGLHIHWPREIVDAVTAEETARSKDRSAAGWTRRTMDSLNATVLNDYLNAGGQMLRVLETAALVDEKDTEWQGKKARLLTLKVTPPMSAKDKKYVKEMNVTGKVWLDADGWPLAAEQTVDVKGRALLVITFEQHEKQEFRYARTNDRLVTVYHLKESDHSGGGEHGHDRSVATLVPQKA